METHHWVLLALVFVGGYVVARFFPSPGQMVGLP